MISLIIWLNGMEARRTVKTSSIQSDLAPKPHKRSPKASSRIEKKGTVPFLRQDFLSVVMSVT